MLLCGAAGQLYRGGKHAAVFQRQEGGWQAQEQENHPAEQQAVDQYPAQTAVQNSGNAFFVALGVAIKHPVKPAEETGLSVMLALMQRFEQGGAQSGGQDHRHQNRQHHGGDDSNRELAVNGPGSAAEEGHRDKHR